MSNTYTNGWIAIIEVSASASYVQNMKNRIYILFIISSLLGCSDSKTTQSSIEKKFNTCLGEDKVVLLDSLVESFEDFLISNHYAENYSSIPKGIARYIDDIKLGVVPIDSLVHDKKKNSKLVKELAAQGFLKNEDGTAMSFNELQGKNILFYNLSGSPYFDPYTELIPCLKSTNDNSSQFVNYYLEQKDEYGDLSSVIFSHALQNGTGTKKYELKIAKEIIVFELYIGIILNNIEKSSAHNSG